MQELENLTSDKINLIKHIYEWNQQITHFADMKVNVLQIINTLIISFSATFSAREAMPHQSRLHLASFGNVKLSK